MTTELQIIYSILKTVRSAELNNDENVSERLLLSYIRKHRPDILRKHYNNGHTIGDEVFQTLPITLLKKSAKIFFCNLPKTVMFEHNYGVNISLFGIPFQIVTNEDFYLYQKNNKMNFFPIGTIVQNTLHFFIGNPDSTAYKTNSETHYAIKHIHDTIYQIELNNYNNETQLPIQFDVDYKAVLVNPDEQPGYSFENSIFPFPAERLPELEQTILSKEFNIILSTKKDEIQNARQDYIRYHDNENIEQ